jgi:hypothetical protein
MDVLDGLGETNGGGDASPIYMNNANAKFFSE